MHLIDGIPDRVFLINPGTKTYGEYRTMLEGIYGKASEVVECKVTYSVSASRRRKAKAKAFWDL